MFENIDYIYCVYKEKSFSKAAEKLFISQPSLSLTIKKAEQIIGTPIFDRSKSPIQLTEFGVHYIKAIEQIFDLEEELNGYLKNIELTLHGTLSIGGGNFCITYILPKLIEHYQNLYPNIQIQFQEVGAAQAPKLLDSGAVDLVIVNRELDSKRYIQHELYQENLVLAIPKKYPINETLSSIRLSRSDILEHKNWRPETPSINLSTVQIPPMVTLKPGNTTRTHLEQIFSDYQIQPSIYLELDQSVSVYQAANYGMGSTLVSDLLPRYIQTEDNLWFYKIDHPLVARTTSLYSCKKHYLPKSAVKFVELAVTELAFI